MTQAHSVPHRSLALLCATALAAAGLVATAVTADPAAAATSPGHDRLVSAVPKVETPNVQDESVDTIYDAGDKIIAGGDFSRVRSVGANADDVRSNLFAFDEKTGVVDTGFDPVMDGVVNAIIGGPTPGTVYIAGRFSNVDGNTPKLPKIALLNVSDGSPVASFKPPAFNGAINDIKLVGNRVLVAGSFTGVTSGPARNGLASLDATTGALNDYLTVSLTENHSWTPTSTGMAKAPVGADKMAVSPNGTQVVVIGNFKKANGATHDQVVRINLGSTSATVADWDTEAYRPICAPKSFDSYVRDVSFSPGGTYFVIVTTGSRVLNTLCDTAARWSATTTGSGQQPTWVARTGGDTLLSVAVSEEAVYVGGHMRWMNNDLGWDAAKFGAVTRASLAALDIRNGLPLSWNPGRNPRGYGVTDLYLTPQGLWVGHDQDWIGNEQYKRKRIAFFPLAGGVSEHSVTRPSLPGNIYTIGGNAPTAALVRINAGGEPIVSADGGPNWQTDSPTAASRYHNTGSTATTGRGWVLSTKSVLSTTPRELFNSERTGTATAPNQNWDIPIATGTKVIVRLYFAARCACATGRTFHVTIDGVRKLTDFDITASVGNDVGTVRSYSITSDGNVDIDLLKSAGYPLINGIEIVRDPAPARIGTERKMFKRSYDGYKAVGARSEITNPGDIAWESARGGFWVGGSLFFVRIGSFYRAPFNGTTLGTPTAINPHSDAKWNSVITASKPEGQTYAGVPSDFYHEMPNITGMFYESGRIYYTIAGHSAMYWRWFSPDSVLTGAVRNTVPGTTSFADAGGVFISDGRLYIISRTSGNLTRMTWTSGAPSGTPSTVSGPTIDGNDWRGKIVTVGP